MALVDLAHRTPISGYKMIAVLLSSSSLLLAGARAEALMAEAMPDWYVVLVCGGLAVLLGFSVLLCAMILDDRRDAAARVLALRGGGDHVD